MLDCLHQLFSWVCGQRLAHTWSPDGELLPCCQRCTGVYVGAFIAALLHLARPPQATIFWLWLNGGFLLFMVPAGFHWLPPSPELRAASGILFGCGLVAFLWLPRPGNISSNPESENFWKRLSFIFTVLFAALVLTPLLGASENPLAAVALAWLTVGGALALALLLAADLLLAARGLWCWVSQRARRLAV